MKCKMARIPRQRSNGTIAAGQYGSGGIQGRVRSIGLLKGKRKVEEDTVKDLSKSLRRALLEADFNVRQAKELTERVERGILEEEP